MHEIAEKLEEINRKNSVFWVGNNDPIPRLAHNSSVYL